MSRTANEHPMPVEDVNALEWTEVESSNLHSIAQEGDFLYVRFANSGMVYRYRLPAEEGYDLLIEAESDPSASVGKEFHKHVRGRQDVETAQVKITE